MNGFLPLVEAFLAFALTMLALATAVSALVGVWLRIFRWRAFGLRQSISLLYDQEIEPLLARIDPAGRSESERADFIGDMTFGLELLAAAERGAERSQRLKELRVASQRPPSSAFARALLWPLRRFRIWHSLRFGVDYLTKAQFQSRLVSSRAGQRLKNKSEKEWDTLTVDLGRAFDGIGETATEAFAKRARVRTVVAGLALAIGINIDAFGLLNVYMTDREIRHSVIAQQEKILAQKTLTDADADEAEQGAAGGERSRLEHTIEALRGSIDELASVSAQLSEDSAVFQEVDNVLNGMDREFDALVAAKSEVDGAMATTRVMAAQLTKSFPIGWDGYPNCYDRTLDARCALAYERLGALDGKASKDETPNDDARDFATRLSAIAAEDTAAFAKWFLGILLSGLMVGLGAPFWVQTVNRVLKVKSYIEGKGTEGSDRPRADSPPGSNTAHDKPPAG